MVYQPRDSGVVKLNTEITAGHKLFWPIVFSPNVPNNTHIKFSNLHVISVEERGMSGSLRSLGGTEHCQTIPPTVGAHRH